MYTGKNPSALRSMEWIRQALLTLLEGKKYAQISIKEICAQADLSRQTFYQMFASKDEVMQYHFMILFRSFAQECDSFQQSTIGSIAEHFFSFFYGQRAFVQTLIANNLTSLMEEQFEIYLGKIALFSSVNERETHGDYTTAYIAGALTRILVHWFEHAFDLTAAELSQLTEDIMTGRTIKDAGLT